ncbi:hypothetical protein ABL78_5645 [Leptomonas seymouri]|uniref:Uncharacterized protein n=1 Tax=Leptomonas seymouri TaxID=5684 RepID=A0A0N1I1Y8_LEPSE|nr:hypothetical protein ABL78_5645 [Leptomonas seymouri]|eukprot:KPI85305.1 hypothetical protein ABL78_5645 [Leptomonas seymouri]
MSNFTTSVIAQSANNAECEIASCATHITLSYELDNTMRTAPPSELDDQLSLDPSLDSSCSTAAPDARSTQCSTPVNTVEKNTAASTLPSLRRVTSADGCSARMPDIYKRAAENEEVRVAIAANAKLVFHTLTSFDVDEIFALLFVKEMWFSAEVIIHALCLVNRISFCFPSWYEHAIETDTNTSSYADSPIGDSSVVTTRAELPHVCSSTSSDFSHHDNTDAFSERSLDVVSRSPVRSSSDSTSSLGDVFTRSNSPRCMMALLLLSSKFHGDVVYNTASLSNAVNKFRDEQAKMLADAPLSLSSGPRRKPLLRVLPATLGQCEKRLFHELGCSVFVHKEEYLHCANLVLKGL